MLKPSDIRIRKVDTQTERIAYRTPIKFGGRIVDDAVLLHVTVDVETRSGRRGRGLGSMPMGNVWAWPSGEVPAETTLAAMTDLGRRFARRLHAYHDWGHPLEITSDTEAWLAEEASGVEQELGLDEPIPRLAQLVSASPAEAAIHDGFGKSLGLNSYNLLGPEFANRDLSAYLTNDFAGEFLDRYTLRSPKATMPLYHLVGALDPLTSADVKEAVSDGLPETLGQWIAADELTHLKIKLAGDDIDWDVTRVAAVEQVAAEAQAKRGCLGWCYSLDFNEKCEHVQYVLDFLARLRETSKSALVRVQYIEQPTRRDLQSAPENCMHEAARIKPVVIDESLVDLESLQLARELGYSGVALKACKGQTGALLMGAAAQKYEMFLCVQDLTCPGASFLHSASLAARIPGVAAIEGNARQYCPEGNRGWSDLYPTMFRISNGTVGTAVLDGPGLGYDC